MSVFQLNQDDIQNLLNEKSEKNKKTVISKLVGDFKSGNLSEEEVKLANEIFLLMVRDIDKSMRKVISKGICDCIDITSELVDTIVLDPDPDVACPVLKASPLLDETKLINFAKKLPESHNVAIADRQDITDDLSSALINTGSAAVVKHLVKNSSAVIGGKNLNRIIDNFGSQQEISDSMACRQALPDEVTLRLIDLVSDHVRTFIVTHQNLPGDIAATLLRDNRRRASMRMLGVDSSEGPDVDDLVEALYENGKLSDSVIYQAGLVGDSSFLVSALALRARIPVSNAHLLVHDKRRAGIRALFKYCNLSLDMVEPIYYAITQSIHLSSATDEDQDGVEMLIAERVLQNYAECIPKRQINYLMTRI